MAHKKGQGSSRNGRDSPGQARGIKVYGGETVHAGSILVKQCGTKIHPGRNVGMGRDYSIFATVDGVVRYEREGRDRKRVSVYTAEQLKVVAEQAARFAASQANKNKKPVAEA